ncbi:MAG: methyltransferase domain-containing protein [Planctomycetota bacterium]
MPDHHAESREYVLGTDPIELDRLGVQHRLWGDVAHALWQRAGFQPGMRILDVGSGPGYASIDLAQLVGHTGRVVGIDESAGFIEELNRRAGVLGLDHLTGSVGDVQAIGDVNLDDHEPFDAAFARWVLCFVPDPSAVIRGIADRLKPGGRVVLFDYFNYESMTMGPREPVFDRVVDAIGNAWRAPGGDPDVMGSMPGVLAEAGLDVTHLGVHQRIARPGEPMWAWPTTFWASFLPRVVETGFMSEDLHRNMLAMWERASGDPTRFMSLPPVWEIVAVKPG